MEIIFIQTNFYTKENCTTKKREKNVCSEMINFIGIKKVMLQKIL